MSKRRRVASASSTRRRVASASSTRRRAASPSPGTHSRYSCGTDSSAEPEPMGDLGPFTSGGPTTALVDDALLGDAVTEDRRSCSSCGPNKARNKCFSTERQTDMCGYRNQKQPCACCERLVSGFCCVCFAGLPYTGRSALRARHSERNVGSKLAFPLGDLPRIFYDRRRPQASWARCLGRLLAAARS